MKAKRIGGGVLVASALIAGWLIVAPPWAGDGGVPAIVTGTTNQGSPSVDTRKKGPPPAFSKAAATAAQPMQPAVVAAAAPRPVTGGARACSYGVMDENGQVVPPPRPTVMAEVCPSMPENGTTGTERGHDRGPNFNLGLYRQADGSIYRPWLP